MKFTKFTTSSLISGLLLGLFSCIDNDYDLNKDINLEINVGGNLSLPIGKTDTIRLSRMIEEGDVLHVIDGKYVINKADNISENIDAIDPVVIDNFAPDFTPYTRRFETQTGEIPDIPGLEVPNIEVEFEADIHTTEHFNISTEIPTEVKAVKSIKVTDNNGKTLLTTLDIAISGMPAFIPRLYLVGVELKFPQVLDFDIEASNEIVRDGASIFISKTVELNQGSGKISIPVTVYGFSNPIVENGTLILTDEIAINGKIYADKQTVGANDLENTTINIQPDLTLPTPQIRVDKVAGTIVPNVNINTSVSLSDLPDFLKEEGTALEVKDLSLGLSVQNPIEAPISTKFRISPLNENGDVVNDNVVSLALKIAGGQKSDFTITKNSPEITSGSLTALLHTIPDKIDIEVTEVEVESENDDQAISLGKNDYNINIDYDINVPLEFENLRIFYNDTIEDLSSDLADITDKVKHLEISAVVDNAIPVDLTLSVEPRNKAGEIISGITLPESVKIEAAPNGNGTIQSTAVKITIKEERDKALQELDKLSIKIEGVNSDSNNDVTLRPDQFIVVRMSAKLPDGAQMDLDDL